MSDPGRDPRSVVWLIDAEGREHPHEILEVLDVGDHAYAALLRLRVDEAGRAALDPDRTVLNFLRLEISPSGEEILVEIDDPREVQAVFDAWTDYLDTLGV